MKVATNVQIIFLLDAPLAKKIVIEYLPQDHVYAKITIMKIMEIVQHAI